MILISDPYSAFKLVQTFSKEKVVELCLKKKIFIHQSVFNSLERIVKKKSEVKLLLSVKEQLKFSPIKESSSAHQIIVQAAIREHNLSIGLNDLHLLSDALLYDQKIVTSDSYIQSVAEMLEITVLGLADL